MQDLILGTVVSVVADLAVNGIKQITNSNRNKYESALFDVVQNSIKEFESKYQIKETDKIPFYGSEVVLNRLMKIRLSPSKSENYDLLEAIKQDSRVLVPTTEDIKLFMGILETHIQKNEKIKKLNIEFNYKEEIFNVSENVSVIKQNVSDVSAAVINIEKEVSSIKEMMRGKDLEFEWNSQLEEIKRNLYDFKPTTALERIKALEERVTSKNIQIPSVNASLSYIKALCLMELHEDAADNEISALFISAYTAYPDNNEYKMYASHSYLTLKNYTRAEQLADELLNSDPFHIGAWSIKCYLNESNIRDFIKQSVPQQVLQNRQFKAQIAYWLLQSKTVVRIAEIESLGLGLEIVDPNEPNKITYKNKIYWSIFIQYMFHKLTEENQIYSIYGYPSEVLKSDLLRYCNDISFKINTAIKGTELEKKYAPIIFLYHYTNFLITGNKSDLTEFERLFKQTQNKSYIDVFRMIQAYNTINTKESREKAIKLVNEFGEDKSDILCLCNSDNYYAIGDYENSKASFKKYLDLKATITEMEAYNIMNRYLTIFKDPDSALNSLADILQTKQFESEMLKNVLGAVIESLYSTDKENAYNKLLALDVAEIPMDLRKFIGSAFLALNKPFDAVNHFKKYVDTSTPSLDLKLLCESLFKSGADTVTLHSLLQHWRENFPPDFNLLNMELELWRLEAEWEKAKDIAEQAINKYPNDEIFLTAIFLTSRKLLDIATVKHFAAKASTFPFGNEVHAINVANALLWAGCERESLNVIYNTALQEKNIAARQQYIYMLGHYPKDFFNEFDVVAVNTFVKYKVGDKIDILEITDENCHSFPAELLLCKYVNSTFTVPKELSKTSVIGTILRITDKYFGLLEKILEDAKDPMSGIQMEVIDLPENASIEEINKKLVELYGVNGSLEKKRIEDVFQGYYNNQVSFTDISQRIFQGNQFDAYHYLTSKASKFYKALPPVFGKHLNLHSVKTFVLDASSLCFFERLTEEHNIQFQHTFIVSSLLKDELQDVLEEAKVSPATELSIRITQEGVTPHFYSETFREDRVARLEKISRWVEKYCTVVSVHERINLLLKEKERINPHGIANLIIDNILLSERPQHVLLSNDLVYFNYFPHKTSTIISPDLYVRNFVKITLVDYSRFAIAQKHVGISIARSVFIEELTKMLTNEENNYLICLTNLRSDWNPDKQNVLEVVYILKWLYLEPWINWTTKNAVAQGILSNLLSGIKPQYIEQIQTLLQNQFLLIPDKFDELMKVFNDVLLIKGLKK